jgi:RNA polymerase sigma-70 factor (ECF subfamily)
MAFLFVLAMTPAERVAFIRHEVFGYPLSEIAGIAGRTAVACGKLASSGRQRIRSARAPAAPAASQAAIIRGFYGAWQAGDIGALVAMLDPDVTITSDRVTRIWAIRNPDKPRPWVMG